MLVFLHKMIFIENEVALLRKGTWQGICSYNLVYKFLIQLLPLQSPVFVMHFLTAFWRGNEAFPKVVLRMKLFLFL